jgi:TolB-like protein
VDGEESNEIRIARELFKKAEDFSPSEDPIIRVQFGRLRKNLSRYYETEGAGDPIVIEIPGRSYRPKFHVRGDEDDSMAPRAVRNREESGAPLELVATVGGSNLPGAIDDEPGDDRTSMAVLPFANLTNDPKQDAFCYGLTEEITSGLAAGAAVKVVASSSASQFRDESADVRQVGKELGVPLVLGGSVRMERGRARVTAQLARAGDGLAVWADTFDGRVNGALNTQRLMAKKVIDSMPLNGEPSEPTDVPQAKDGTR